MYLLQCVLIIKPLYMKRKLLSLAVLASVTFFSLSLHAQVKGDPAANGTTPTLVPQKTSSRLSPDLKKLYDNKGARAKIVQSTKKPTLPEDAMNTYIQIKGDKVVVDVTVKGDAQAARTELQKMGFQFKASYGRVISGLMPISSLPQLESAATIRFAKPAYKPLNVTRPVDLNGYSPKPTAAPVGDQGDTAQRSTLARKKYKVDGSGVKVGILSNSYNNLGGAAKGVASGELPGPGNPFHYKKPVQVLEDLDSNGTDEGSNFVARQNGDGEENRCNDKGVGNGENEYTIEVRFPDDGSPALGNDPGHELCEKNAGGNAENRDEGDDRRAKEAADQEVETAHGRGKYDLVRIEIEVSRGGGVDEGGGH